jgi:holo-[acyl-carrier protein] synthase
VFERVLIMDTNEKFRGVVAQFLGVDAALLEPQFSLGGQIRSSIARATLQARLRRELGIMPPPLAGLNTYQQLEAACLGINGHAPVAAVEAVLEESTPAASGLACGIDIEFADALPTAVDYWDAPFYRDHFSDTEIADCVSRENPREHFAARWAAKEALIKCDARWANVPLAQVEIRRDETGRPAFFDRRRGEPRPMEVSVSLSHTNGLAAAVVVVGAPESSLPRAVVPVPPPEPATLAPPKSNHLPIALALVSLLLALAALFR